MIGLLIPFSPMPIESFIFGFQIRIEFLIFSIHSCEKSTHYVLLIFLNILLISKVSKVFFWQEIVLKYFKSCLKWTPCSLALIKRGLCIPVLLLIFISANIFGRPCTLVKNMNTLVINHYVILSVHCTVRQNSIQSLISES